MSWDRYLELTHAERWLLHDALTSLIDRASEAGEIRNKDMRK